LTLVAWLLMLSRDSLYHPIYTNTYKLELLHNGYKVLRVILHCLRKLSKLSWVSQL